MPLVKETLTNNIKGLLNNLVQSEDQEASIDNLATELANIIDTYIKTGTVTVAAGIPVATAGSAAAQTGATTATGTGTIS